MMIITMKRSETSYTYVCGKHVQTINEHRDLKDSCNRLLWKLAKANP